MISYMERYKLSDEKIRDYHEKYAEKIRGYLDDDSKYGLSYNFGENIPIKWNEWYEFIGSDLGRESQSTDKEDAIEKGRKIVRRLDKVLRILWELDCEESMKKIEKNNKNDHQKDVDYIKLLTFLYKFSKNEGIKLKSLFKMPSLENSEYVTVKNFRAKNAEIMTVMQKVIMSQVNEKTYGELSFWLFHLENTVNKVEDRLWYSFGMDEIDNVIFEKIDTIIDEISEKTKTVLERRGKDNFTIYEEFLFRLDIYALVASQIDRNRTHEYIFQMEIPDIFKEVSFAYINLFCAESIKVTDIVRYAEIDVTKNMICYLLHISSQKYNRIVRGLLKQYINIVGASSEINLLQLIIMIQEIENGLNDKPDKALLRFYRAETKDMQKTLKAGLREDKSQLMLENLLIERINAKYYYYTGRYEKYLKLLRIVDKLYKSSFFIKNYTGISQIEEGVKIAIKNYERILVLLEK